jgi:hypothetical protein
LNREEAGKTGRAFAHMASGRNHDTTCELPKLGKFASKQFDGDPAEQAGLVSY